MLIKVLLLLFHVSRFYSRLPLRLALLCGPEHHFYAAFSIRKADEPSTSYSVRFQFLVRLWMAKPCLGEQSFEIWDLLKTG